jgi:hypothetical protein
MAGAFGLLSDNHPSHFPSDRLVENLPRLDIWMLLQSGALTEGAVTELKWGEKGYWLAKRGPNLLVDGNPIVIAWDEPMPGVERPWFQCQCGRRVRHLYLRDPIGCRSCLKLDYSSRHLRRQTPGVGRVERLRKKLGGCDTHPFTPLPASRPGRHRGYHQKLVATIRDEEAKLVEHLQTVTRDLERRIQVRKRRHQW